MQLHAKGKLILASDGRIRPILQPTGFPAHVRSLLPDDLVLHQAGKRLILSLENSQLLAYSCHLFINGLNNIKSEKSKAIDFLRPQCKIFDEIMKAGIAAIAFGLSVV